MRGAYASFDPVTDAKHLVGLARRHLAALDPDVSEAADLVVWAAERLTSDAAARESLVEVLDGARELERCLRECLDALVAVRVGVGVTRVRDRSVDEVGGVAHGGSSRVADGVATVSESAALAQANELCNLVLREIADHLTSGDFFADGGWTPLLKPLARERDPSLHPLRNRKHDQSYVRGHRDGTWQAARALYAIANMNDPSST